MDTIKNTIMIGALTAIAWAILLAPAWVIHRMVS